MLLTGALQNSISHFSFRDDATICFIADWLANTDRAIRILDCGCQDARLAKVLMLAELDLNRICYFGFDSNSNHVRSANAEKQCRHFDGYQKLHIKLRDITDTDGYEVGTFDLIILSNLLHEILVESIPQILLELNRLLTPSTGRIIFTDMEELPVEEIEPWTVLWTGDELARVLLAGGFAPSVSKFSKRVRVYRVVNWAASNVDIGAITDALLLILLEKKEQLMATAMPYRACGNASADSQLVACRLGAIEMAIQHLTGKAGP